MKKRTLLLILLLLVCLLGIAIFPRRIAPPTVATSFLGFTNASGGYEALFALSNPPPASVSLHSVRRLLTLTNNAVTREAGNFSWGRREQWGMLYAIDVASTNEPLRVVFQFQQRAVGVRRLGEQLRELWGRFTRNEREFFTGSIFLVTNETQPATGLGR